MGLNGNAFHLLGSFAAQARREGWTKEEINAVLSEAMRGNYDHLVVTLYNHCAPTTPPPEEDFEEDAGDHDEDDD